MDTTPFIFILIGTIVGSIMGLTGAGGALISIPLFIQFSGISLKLATVYSLLTVMISAFLSFVSQRKSTRYYYSVIIAACSAVGSWVSLPIKNLISTHMVICLLTVVALFSLYSTWKPFKQRDSFKKGPQLFGLLVFTGILLGVLTTLTGLGGGILIMPMLFGVFGLSGKEALPTGLFAIFISSMLSFLMQVKSISQLPSLEMILGLIFGVFISILFVQQLIQHLSLRTISMARKLVFSMMVFFSLISIYLKG